MTPLAQTTIYTRHTNRLVSAGAECVVVTSIAGHFCIDEFKAVSPLPVVDMLAEVSRASKLAVLNGSELLELAE